MHCALSRSATKEKKIQRKAKKRRKNTNTNTLICINMQLEPLCVSSINIKHTWQRSFNKYPILRITNVRQIPPKKSKASCSAKVRHVICISDIYLHLYLDKYKRHNNRILFRVVSFIRAAVKRWTSVSSYKYHHLKIQISPPPPNILSLYLIKCEPNDLE